MMATSIHSRSAGSAGSRGSAWSAGAALALAGSLLLVGALAGCGTPDPLKTVADATATAAPTGGAASGARESGAGGSAGGQPVETNEVRLTWVETGGASTVSLVLGQDTPYQAVFEVATDAALAVESVSLSPAGGAYSIASDGCTGVAIATGSPCIVTVGFDPPTAGSYTTTLVVGYAGGGRAELPVPISVVDPAGATDGAGTNTGTGTGTGTGGAIVQPTGSAPPG